MSTKKHHHIIPQVYQREFLDFSKPTNFPVDKPFIPSLWQIDRGLKLEPIRKSPRNTLWKTKFYKLDSDSDENHIIEDSLSNIERNYSGVLKKLKSKIPLNTQELFSLIVFIETLHQRTESQIEHWQTQFSKIEDIYRKVDQHLNNNQNFSDEFWKNSHEIGKRLILAGIGAMGKLLIDEGIYFLLNESEMSFVSSDNPATWTFKHIDELQTLSIPSQWLREGVKPNTKSFFCYCPLTPKIALFSSPLLKSLSEQKYQYWETTYLPFIFSMNFLTHISAESVIISDKPNPYGSYRSQIANYLEMEKSSQKITGKYILFYTSTNRYWLQVENYEHILDNPIKSKIEFWTKDFETLDSIAKDELIETVHLYEDGIERGFSRNLIFNKASFDEEEPSILNQI